MLRFKLANVVCGTKFEALAVVSITIFWSPEFWCDVIFIDVRCCDNLLLVLLLLPVA